MDIDKFHVKSNSNFSYLVSYCTISVCCEVSSLGIDEIKAEEKQNNTIIFSCPISIKNSRKLDNFAGKKNQI